MVLSGPGGKIYTGRLWRYELLLRWQFQADLEPHSAVSPTSGPAPEIQVYLLLWGLSLFLPGYHPQGAAPAYLAFKNLKYHYWGFVLEKNWGSRFKLALETNLNYNQISNSPGFNSLVEIDYLLTHHVSARICRLLCERRDPGFGFPPSAQRSGDTVLPILIIFLS